MRSPLLPLSLAALVGCSDTSNTSRPVAATQPASPAPSAEEAATQRAVGQVAEAFLNAVLSGDAARAASLLTEKAARRHAADPSALSAMGTAVDGLSVREVRLLNADEAAASCLITESGAEEPAELCCLLKREPSGWRVCGVASETEGEPPAVISFEGPSEPATPPSQLVERPDATEAAPKTAADPGDARLR